jgi:hypothetical protein
MGGSSGAPVNGGSAGNQGGGFSDVWVTFHADATLKFWGPHASSLTVLASPPVNFGTVDLKSIFKVSLSSGGRRSRRPSAVSTGKNRGGHLDGAIGVSRSGETSTSHESVNGAFGVEFDSEVKVGLELDLWDQRVVVLSWGSEAAVLKYWSTVAAESVKKDSVNRVDGGGIQNFAAHGNEFQNKISKGASPGMKYVAAPVDQNVSSSITEVGVRNESDEEVMGCLSHASVEEQELENLMDELDKTVDEVLKESEHVKVLLNTAPAESGVTKSNPSKTLATPSTPDANLAVKPFPPRRVSASLATVPPPVPPREGSNSSSAMSVDSLNPSALMMDWSKPGWKLVVKSTFPDDVTATGYCCWLDL